MEQSASNDSTGPEVEKTDEEKLSETEVSKESGQSENNEFKNKFYYLAAEMENIKKRHQKDLENSVKYGSEKILKNLVEVVDNFERTTAAMGPLESIQDEKMKNLLVGIEMIRKQFLDALAQSGLVPIEALGKIFDPNLHEALSQMVAEGKKEGEVVMEYQKGYLLNGRLLRPSKVVVAKNEEN